MSPEVRDIFVKRPDLHAISSLIKLNQGSLTLDVGMVLF